LPVFHIGHFRPTINMLSCICKVGHFHLTRQMEGECVCAG
jgi:hypothetical protein